MAYHWTLHIDAPPEKVFDALVDVMFKGAFFLTQKLDPLIADGGSIVNISSGMSCSPGGDTSAPGWSLRRSW